MAIGYDIWTMNEMLVRQERLTRGAPSLSPRISPDGRQIVYAQSAKPLTSDVDEGVDWSLHVMDIDGSHDRSLTNGVSDRDPDWSPDGREVVFERLDPQTRRSTIMVVDVATGRERTVVAAGGHSPGWSPAGDAIGFIRSFEFWTVDPDGAGERRVLDFTFASFRWSWSPSGRRIAYAETTKEGAAVHTADVASGAVADVPGSHDDPSHAPWSITWTKDDTLYFARHTNEPDIQIEGRGSYALYEVVASDHATEEPQRIRRTIPGEDFALLNANDNPACPP